MDTYQIPDLTNLLRTLADESRLTMIGLMSGQGRTVSEMAGLLDLSDTSVSQHINKLHSAGLLRLRTIDNQRFYSLNQARMSKFKAYVGEIDTLPTEPEREVSDDAWIDALDWSEDDKKTLRHYTCNGRLTEFPIKDKAWMVILRWLATKFQPGIRYTEREVNAIVTEFHEDYASLRRNLIEYGLMQRELGGGAYWLKPGRENGA